MQKARILEGIKKARESSEKRKFTQMFDLIFNLKDMDLKREADKINTFLTLPHTLGKRVRIGALVGEELSTKAKSVCDAVVVQDQFKKLDKKAIKKLAEQMDFFIGQADIMPQIAGAFGKILGPRGKIPNPKAGCIIPPTADPKAIVERLQKVVKAETKNELTIKLRVGSEKMSDDELADNILACYNGILAALPQEKNNLKSMILKLTMGKPVHIEEKIAVVGEVK